MSSLPGMTGMRVQIIDTGQAHRPALGYVRAQVGMRTLSGSEIVAVEEARVRVKNGSEKPRWVEGAQVPLSEVERLRAPVEERREAAPPPDPQESNAAKVERLKANPSAHALAAQEEAPP